jgi:hypothetical protein
MNGGVETRAKSREDFFRRCLKGSLNFPELLRDVLRVDSGIDSVDFAQECVFHLSAEWLCTESHRAAYILFPLLKYLESSPDEVGAVQAAFGCVCRCTTPSHPDMIDKFLSFHGVNAFEPIENWPCSSCSCCGSSFEMCRGRPPVDLAIMSMNFTALERIYSSTTEPRIHTNQLAHLYRRNHRISREQVERTRAVVKRFFPENDNEDLHSAARLIAVLEEGSAGILDTLHIEEMGIWCRRIQSILPELTSIDGSRSLLSLVACMTESVRGRDAVFRYLLRLVAPKETHSLVDFAVRENPSFWISQSPDSSPAYALGGQVQLTDFVYHMYYHLRSRRADCRCKVCGSWRSTPDAFSCFEKWIKKIGDNEKLEGHRILFDLGNHPSMLVELKGKAELSVVDHLGSTVLHYSSNMESLHRLVMGGADVNAIDIGGKSALDLAIELNQKDKVKFLLGECHCFVSLNSLDQILGIVEGNRKLFRVFRECLRSIAVEKPDPSAVTIIANLQLELERECEYRRSKIARLENTHKKEIEDLARQHDKRCESDMIALKNSAEDRKSAYTRILELEGLLSQAKAEKFSLTNELEAMSDKVSKLKKRVAKEIESREYERQQLLAEGESRECTVCMERNWDTALMCGHCYCSSCVKTACQQACPTCSKRTTGKIIKLFNCRK